MPVYPTVGDTTPRLDLVVDPGGNKTYVFDYSEDPSLVPDVPGMLFGSARSGVFDLPISSVGNINKAGDTVVVTLSVEGAHRVRGLDYVYLEETGSPDNVVLVAGTVKPWTGPGPAPSDRVEVVPGAAETIIYRTGGAGPQGAPGLDGLPGAGLIDAAAFDVAADDSTDDTAAWQDAIDAVAAMGGGALTFPNTGTQSIISSLVYVPGSVGIWGNGAKWDLGGGTSSVFKTTGTGCLRFGNNTVAGDTAQGPVSGNFQIDGSAGGSTAGLFQSLMSIERNFQSINVTNAPGVAFLVEHSQNCNFVRCSSNNALTDGLVIDKGAGGLLFSGFEFAGSGRDGISIKDTTPTVAGVFAVPSHITFHHGIAEYAHGTTGTFRNCLRAEACGRVIFDNVAFGATGVNGTDGYVVRLTDSDVVFRDTQIDGNHATTGAGLVHATSSRITLSGSPRFEVAPTVFTLDTTAWVLADRVPYRVNTGALFTLTGGAQLGSSDISSPTGVAVVTAAGAFNYGTPADFGYSNAVVTANATANALPAGLYPGHRFTMGAYQTGAFTFAFPASGIVWAGGTPPALPATVGAYVKAEVIWDGSAWWEV